MKKWNITGEATESTDSAEIEKEELFTLINVEKYADLMKHLQSSGPFDMIEQAHSYPFCAVGLVVAQK